jgi:hypothetical protein
MKYLTILLVWFFGWFSTTPFSDVSATEQGAAGGRKESGTSIHYQIKMKANANPEKLQFNKMWIGTDYAIIKVYALDENGEIKADFVKGDVIYIDAYQRFTYDESGSKSMQIQSTESVPKEYKGKAILQYTFKGKVDYLTIEEFKKLPRIEYP